MQFSKSFRLSEIGRWGQIEGLGAGDVMRLGTSLVQSPNFLDNRPVVLQAQCKCSYRIIGPQQLVRGLDMGEFPLTHPATFPPAP